MKKIKIEDQNLYYRAGDREYRIRGFEDIILSHMRVNIKVTHQDRFFIDIVDLYSQKSRTLFMNKACRGLEIKRDKLQKDLYEIIDIIERYQSDKNEPEKREPVKITNKDKEKAEKELKHPDLIKSILRDIECLGFTGEEKNKIITYLVSISRKLPDPLSAIIMSESSAGKSALSESIEKLTPPEEIVYLSNLTPKALFYMDKDYLKHKFVIIEEREGSNEADYPIRILQSQKRLIQAVPVKDPNTNKTRTRQIEVEGPISYIETTTRIQVNYENSTRCFELYLDSSAAQTSRIHRVQKELKTPEGLRIRSKHDEIIKKHHNMQRLLKQVRIANPYSNYINFPTGKLRTRRDHMRFLNLIECITFLHQYQRPVKRIREVEYVETTLEDYRIAYDLYSDILNNTFSDLKKPQKELLEHLKAMTGGDDDLVFSRKDIREYTGYPHHKVRDLIKTLEELEYLIIESGTKGKQYRYRLNTQVGLKERFMEEISKPEELEEYASSAS